MSGDEMEDDAMDITHEEKQELDLITNYDDDHQVRGPRVDSAKEALKNPYDYIMKELSRVPNRHTGWSKNDPSVIELGDLIRRIMTGSDKRVVHKKKGHGAYVVDMAYMDMGHIMEDHVTICPEGCIHTTQPTLCYNLHRAFTRCTSLVQYAAQIRSGSGFQPQHVFTTWIPGKDWLAHGFFVPSDDVAFEMYAAALRPVLDRMHGTVLVSERRDYKTPAIKKAYLTKSGFCEFCLNFEWSDPGWTGSYHNIGDGSDMPVQFMFKRPPDLQYRSFYVAYEDLYAQLDRLVRVHVPMRAKRAASANGAVGTMQYRAAIHRANNDEEKTSESGDDE